MQEIFLVEVVMEKSKFFGFLIIKIIRQLPL